MNIRLSDARISCSEYGSADGLPLVLIHGFPFNQAMWNPQVRSLAGCARIITYDIRGHGSSSVGDGQFTVEMFVDDLVALLDSFSIKQAVLCGLSLGGYIALRAIERFPERICGLILCDTKSEADSNEAKIRRTAMIKAVKTEGVRIFAEEFVKTVFWERNFERSPQTIDFIKNIIRKNSSLGICGTLLALASRTDTTHILSSIGIPACIITGEYDRLTPVTTAQDMHRAIKGSELYILSNAGHMSNLENTQDFNESIIAFLKKHW
jgi:3-oxoadipate enol-lactonase